MNTKSSTEEAKLFGANEVLPQVLWTKYFLEGHGYGADNVLYQDNQSTMKLEQNGKKHPAEREHATLIFRIFSSPIKSPRKRSRFNTVRPSKWLRTTSPSPYRGRSSTRSGIRFSDWPQWRLSMGTEGVCWNPIPRLREINNPPRGECPDKQREYLRVPRMTYVNVPRWSRAIKHGPKWPGLV
jgi:hypothetical protein